MFCRPRLECAFFVIAVAVSRYLFRSRYLYDLDSVNYALGIGHFDPAAHQPHPPGYFLYICIGRLLNGFLRDPNAALVALSIIASCGAVVMIHKLACAWFGPKAAKFAALLFLFSPLAWFHGTVALTYIVESFLSMVVAYLCWLTWRGCAGFVLLAAAILAFTAGVRQSSLLFLGPLFLFSLLGVNWKHRIAGLVTLGLGLFAWFIPMVSASGGLHAYFSALSALWHLVPGQTTVANSSLFTSIARLFTIAGIIALSIGSAGAIFLSTAIHSKTKATASVKVFTSVWLAPGLLFFTFVFLKFVNSGYLLILFPPVCIWLGYWISEWYSNVQLRIPVKTSLVGLAAAANVAIFLYAPVYCSYGAVRRFETELESVRIALPNVASPQRTLIVGFDSHFLGYRHAGYYLPDYTTAQYPEVPLAAGKRVFVMRGGDTRLAAHLEKDQFTNFVLFPLPADGNEYRDYLAQVQSKFPQNHLKTLRAGDHEFIVGPIADLPLLFPEAASRAGLSTSHHSAPETVYSR